MHFIHDATNVENRRAPRPGGKFLLVRDVYRLPIACIGDLDLMLHCVRNSRPWSDVLITLKNVAVMPELFLNITSLNKVQEAHVIRTDPEGAHILDRRILFAKYSTSSYGQASTVARHQLPPLMAAAAFTPGAATAMDINDAHVTLGNIHERAARATAKQMGIRIRGTMRLYHSCAQAKASRRVGGSHTALASSQPLELIFGDMSVPLPEYRRGSM